MKICYLGNDYFLECLKNIYMSSNEIIYVFADNTDNEFVFNDQIKSFCCLNNIPIIEEKISKNQVEGLIFEGNCDLLISAGYSSHIPVIDDLRYRAINVHPTLLPIGKGPWPWPYLILKDIEESGVTIHKISERYDSGDILMQRKFPIPTNSSVELVTHRSHILAAEMIQECLKSFEQFWLCAKRQSEPGEWWGMPTIKDRTIRTTMDLHQIIRVVNAFGHYGSFLFLNGQLIHIKKATGWESDNAIEPSQVIYRSVNEIVVTVKGGYLCIADYQIV